VAEEFALIKFLVEVFECSYVFQSLDLRVSRFRIRSLGNAQCLHHLRKQCRGKVRVEKQKSLAWHRERELHPGKYGETLGLIERTSIGRGFRLCGGSNESKKRQIVMICNS